MGKRGSEAADSKRVPFRARVRQWPVVGYILTLAWSIYKLPVIVRDIQGSDEYLRSLLHDEMLRGSRRDDQINSMLDVQAGIQGSLRGLREQDDLLAGTLRTELARVEASISHVQSGVQNEIQS